MTDEAALLAAILANPDEDTPRLMFADWLDENGHPERAEFVRVQIEVTRLPEAERPTAYYRGLLTRFRQLVAAHAEAWTRALGVPRTRALFRRGFVEEITFAPDEVPTGANRALFREPLRVVKVARGPRDSGPAVPGVPVLRKLASWPGRGRFHTLLLSGLNIPANAVEPFLAAPPVADLRVLDVDGCEFPGEAVVALAESTNLAALERLNLGSVHLSVEQAFALCTPHLKNLGMVEMSVVYDRPDDDAAPDPMRPALDALQIRYGRRVWASRW